MNKELKSYYRILEKHLLCPKAKRTELVKEAERLINDFIDSNPGTDYPEILEFVGEPVQLAQSYNEVLGAESTGRFFRRKQLVRLAVSTLIVVGLISSVAYSIYLFNRQLDVVVTAEKTIIIYENEENDPE